MLKHCQLSKKIIFIICSTCFAIASLSCSKNNKRIEQEIRTTRYETMEEKTDKTITEKIHALSENDFIVKNGDYHISLGETIDEMKVDETAISYKGYSEKHCYETFIYQNFIVKVLPNKNIWYIKLLTSNFETARGIKIGDSIQKVVEKYGLSDEGYDCYIYHKKQKSLIFYIDQNKNVNGILLEE